MATKLLCCSISVFSPNFVLNIIAEREKKRFEVRCEPTLPATEMCAEAFIHHRARSCCFNSASALLHISRSGEERVRAPLDALASLFIIILVFNIKLIENAVIITTILDPFVICTPLEMIDC